MRVRVCYDCTWFRVRFTASGATKPRMVGHRMQNHSGGAAANAAATAAASAGPSTLFSCCTTGSEGSAVAICMRMWHVFDQVSKMRQKTRQFTPAPARCVAAVKRALLPSVCKCGVCLTKSVREDRKQGKLRPAPARCGAAALLAVKRAMLPSVCK